MDVGSSEEGSVSSLFNPGFLRRWGVFRRTNRNAMGDQGVGVWADRKVRLGEQYGGELAKKLVFFYNHPSKSRAFPIMKQTKQSYKLHEFFLSTERRYTKQDKKEKKNKTNP